MTEFSGALIAGGHSRRMGTDKAFLDWRGEPLWKCQAEKLRSLNPAQLFLSCRREQPFPSQPDITPVYDAWPDRGPLGGIASCLKNCTQPLLVVLGIDLTLLPASFLQWLLTKTTAECGAVTVQQSGTAFEPLAAVYPRAMLALAEEQIAGGRLAMQEFIRRGIDAGLMQPVSGAFCDDWFTNVNTPQDRRRMENGNDG
jgi:molybdopterin-guanine dinucleotide biosynthesis protein A